MLERNYENAFLIASGETFKKIGEYSSLRTAVEEIIDAREQKELYLAKYKAALKKIKLVTEASDVLFQMYLVLKLVGKQTNQVTCSWSRFMTTVEQLVKKLIERLKIEASRGQEDEPSEVEIEIDNRFFKQSLVPAVHSALTASIASKTAPLFNLILALRLAQTYRAITPAEHSFILKQLVDLQGYQQWRDPEHKFVAIEDTVDKNRH